MLPYDHHTVIHVPLLSRGQACMRGRINVTGSLEQIVLFSIESTIGRIEMRKRQDDQVGMDAALGRNLGQYETA